MTNNTRTADQIERDITRERAELSDTMHDLQDKFSVKTIVNDLGDMVRNQGGDLGRTITDTVSRNPAAVVLTTVGLAWLFLGQGRGAGAARQSDKRAYDWYDTGRMSRQVRTNEDSADAAPVMDKIRDSAAYVGDTAADLSERLSLGLEHLSQDAKARVLAARHAAHDARQSSQAVMLKGSRAASGFFDDQPLVVGALAVAAGAAIGGLLPHSRIEDDTLGATSDRLYADAQDLYRVERDKAVAAAKVAASDVKGELKDAGTDLKAMLPDGKNVGEVITDRTADAAKRVIDHASDAADGKPKGDGNTQA